MRRLLQWIGLAALWLFLLATIAWSSAALWFDGPSPRAVAGALVVAFVLVALALLVALRPWWRGLVGYGFLFAVVMGWWFSLAPSNDSDWQRDVEHPPTASIEGDRLTIHNLRNFDYRSADDYTPRWETRTYDLSQLVGMDLYFFYWGSPWMAHTIVSWEFEDAPPLAISIETRKEVGEQYSALRGFFRQFELYYVVADERDVVRLRTNLRGDEGYLYRINWSPSDSRALLLAYLEEANRIARSPVWYNAFHHNCTTTIRFHARQIGMARALNWRVLVNGKGPELLYMRGVVNTTLPFPELRSRSYINESGRMA
ncbi:MAG: DUF4105 domain-containing protein, partial [Deltaproteobacteria bacterium]|nr:DUF4105 domain-containing protein [Deltaproteobacteria bacterium]